MNEDLTAKVVIRLYINKKNKVRVRQLIKELLVISAIAEDEENLVVDVTDSDVLADY